MWLCFASLSVWLSRYFAVRYDANLSAWLVASIKFWIISHTGGLCSPAQVHVSIDTLLCVHLIGKFTYLWMKFWSCWTVVNFWYCRCKCQYGTSRPHLQRQNAFVCVVTHRGWVLMTPPNSLTCVSHHRNNLLFNVSPLILYFEIVDAWCLHWELLWSLITHNTRQDDRVQVETISTQSLPLWLRDITCCVSHHRNNLMCRP